MGITVVVKLMKQICIVLLSNFALISCGAAQQEFDNRMARSQLYQFYSVHISYLDKSLQTDSLLSLRDSIEGEYFTENLRQKLKRDRESGKLDWDPFLKANDFDTSWLETLQVKDGSERGSFVVSFLDHSLKEWRRIHIKMALLNDKYLISDIDYFK